MSQFAAVNSGIAKSASHRLFVIPWTRRQFKLDFRDQTDGAEGQNTSTDRFMCEGDVGRLILPLRKHSIWSPPPTLHDRAVILAENIFAHHGSGCLTWTLTPVWEVQQEMSEMRRQ
jgi:hypothetical protein